MHRHLHVPRQPHGPSPEAVGCKCAECPFAKDGKPNRPVRGLLRPKPQGLLIGEGPGYEEVEQGIPFVGPTGEALDKALADVGLAREHFTIVNATACIPIPGASEREKDKAMHCCAPLFDAQCRHLLQLRIPTLVMGALASKAAFGASYVGSRGFIRDGYAIVTWHPTFAFFHNPWEMGAFLVDLDRFARLVRGELAKDGKCIINPTEADVRALLREKFVSVDIETTSSDPLEPWSGKNPYKARMKVLGLGVPDVGLAINWSTMSGAVREAAKELMLERRVAKVLHNGHWFDIPVLRRYGWQVHNVVDTRDMRRALSATSRLSLAYLVSLYEDSEPWKEDDEGDAKGMVFTTKMQDLLTYNAKDCFKTARIYRHMRAEADWKTDRVQRLYGMHTGLSRLAARMNRVGLYVLEDQRRFMMWALKRIHAEAERRFCSMAHVSKCTPDVLRALLFKRHKKAGIPCAELPDPMNPKMYTDEACRTISVKEPVLLLMRASGNIPKEMTPLLDAWWDVQQPSKRMGVVNSGAFAIRTSPDGRFHPNWNSSGTETMRWTCGGDRTDPDINIMALEQILRGCWGAPYGRVLVHMDKSQLELRVMEAVSGDAALLHKLQSGDVYSHDAIEWFQLPPDTNVKKAKPAARKACKIIRLGSQYQAGLGAVYAQGLLEDRDMRFDLTRTLYNSFHKTHESGLDQWAKDELAAVNACGYSEGRLLYGRRVYPAPPPITEVANYPIQRTAGEMMNIEILELERALDAEVPGAEIVVQLHDAFDVECDEDDVDKVIAIMQRVSEREYTICGRTRPFPVEIKTSRDWGDL